MSRLSFNLSCVQVQMPSMTSSLLKKTAEILESKDGQVFLDIHAKDVRKYRSPIDFVLCKYLPVFVNPLKKFYEDELMSMSELIDEKRIREIDSTIYAELKKIFFYINKAMKK